MASNTKNEKPVLENKRAYRMGARAEAAAETGRRILQATVELYMERFYDQVSLEDVAERAGVTVQTVLRRFGSKEELISAAAELARRRLRSQRDQAPVGDVADAVKILIETYEEHGDRYLRLLAQEERVPAFRPITDTGRAYHYAWVERVFAPLLAKRTGPQRERLLAQLIATCDLYFWKLLRRDLGLSREQTELTVIEAIKALEATVLRR
ncbi:MAG: TetR/AcrR family transcriptional regulator [Actinobacteria bacterium]|nr:TetR/AcrR family transcriptional regulator [Actinomycetota bacterium]